MKLSSSLLFIAVFAASTGTACASELIYHGINANITPGATPNAAYNAEAAASRPVDPKSITVPLTPSQLAAQSLLASQVAQLTAPCTVPGCTGGATFLDGSGFTFTTDPTTKLRTFTFFNTNGGTSTATPYSKLIIMYRQASAILCILLLTACSGLNPLENGMVQQASVSDSTRSGEILKHLPLPAVRIPVAVYEFQDQTGQFKANDSITDYSSAVTKGGLAVLTKALNDTGSRNWFMVAERGGLRNLLQEREIIRTMRTDYVNPNAAPLPPLPPLVYAGMLIEGGIIFYDSNVMTGGAAASYFAIGTNASYRRDIVTVYLRAVSISTGEVLTSVTSSKTVFSYGVGANIQHYFSFDRLLEAEAGFTVNEPSQLAVRQAIETALYALIMEGAQDNLWQFADKEAGDRAMREYLARRDGVKTSVIGEPGQVVGKPSAKADDKRSFLGLL